MYSSNKIDILLIEDNMHDVAFVRQAISESGLDIRLHHLPNGADGVDFLLGADGEHAIGVSAQPRMILTDLRMPKMDGYDFLRMIKSDEHTKQIPVIIMSTSYQECDIEKTYALGADSYIVKPMDIDIFMDSLTSIFKYWLGANNPAKPLHDMASFTQFCAVA